MDPKRDYDIGSLYGSDPLMGGWSEKNSNKFVYNDFCYDLTFKIAHIADKLFLWNYDLEKKINFHYLKRVDY